MSVTKKALAAAAVLGFAGALLSPPALAIVSVGFGPAGSARTLQQGTLMAAAEKKKTTKTKTSKEKKPAKSKGGTEPGSSSPKSTGEYN
jgi:hypothetical protein